MIQACCIPNHGMRLPCRHRTCPMRSRQLCNGRNPRSRNCRPSFWMETNVSLLYKAGGGGEICISKRASERADGILLSFFSLCGLVCGLYYMTACLGLVPISFFFFSFLFPVHTTSERFVTGCSRNITREGLFWLFSPESCGITL